MKKLYLSIIITAMFLFMHISGVSAQSFSPERKQELRAEGLTKAQIRAKEEASILLKKRAKLTDKALKVGDQVPDVLMTSMYNYNGGKAKISDFKGKLLILDWWSRNCGSCIQSFPKMEALMDKFDGKMQILAVNSESLEVLNINEPGFPKKSTSAILQKTKLPMVFSNQQLVELFPHITEPYHIWIDGSGKILAMADGTWATEANIKAILEGEKVPFTLGVGIKKLLEPEMYKFDNSRKSILDEENRKYVGNIVYLKRSLEDSRSYALIAKPGYQSRKARSIINLFKSVYKPSIEKPYKLHEFEPACVVVESDNPEKFYLSMTNPENLEKWSVENGYYVEQFNSDSATGLQMLREALAEYFKISASIENRKLNCLVLRRSTPDDKLSTKYPAVISSVKANTSRHTILKNNYFGDFISQLESSSYYALGPNAKPVVDETGIDPFKKVDMDLTNLLDYKGLNAQLKKYGLELFEAEREIEVLVLKDKSGSKNKDN